MAPLNKRLVAIIFKAISLSLLLWGCSSFGQTSPNVASPEQSATSWLMEGGSATRSRATNGEVGYPLQLAVRVSVGGDTQYASPVTIDRELLFVEGDKQLHVFSLGDRSQRWEIPVLGSYLSPAVAGETVFVRAESGTDGYLLALNASSGTQSWQYKFEAVGSSNDNIGGHVTSPVVVDGLVVVGAAKTIEALDAKTGKPRWRTELKDAISSSLAVADGLAYVTDLTTLYALDLYSGGEQWQRQFEQIPPMFSPIVAGDRVFIASKAGIHALNRLDGTTLWDRSFGDQPLIPAAADGDRFFVKTINQLYMLDSKTGDLLWQYEALNYVSIPAVTAEHLYIVTRADGGSQLRVLQKQSGKELWRSENLDLNNGSPVIAGAIVYVRTKAGEVFGFQSKE